MIKRYLAVLMCILIMASQGLHAEETNESSMLECVIKSVKEKIQIPEEMEKFNYYMREGIYYLTWEKEDGKETAFVQAEPDGDILAYYGSRTNEEQSDLAKISFKDAEEAARAFLRKAVPKYESKLEVVSAEIPDKDSAYHITYQLMEQGIEVLGESAAVGVDKGTGEIISFIGIPYEDTRVYETREPVLTMEEAQKIYLNQIGVRLAYQTYYSYEQKKTESFLAYETQNEEQRGISALTGKIITLYRDENERGIFDQIVTQDLAAESSAGSRLTPSEQKAVDETKKLLPAEEIKAKWQQYFKLIQPMNLSSSRLYQTENSYIREIVCRSKNEEDGTWAELGVDAATGDLLSYVYYDNPLTQMAGRQDKKEWNKEEAEQFLLEAVPEYFKKIRFQGASNSVLAGGNTQTFTYERLVNGLPVSGDGIALTYSSDKGEITSFYRTWSDTDFKKPENILSEEEIVKKVGLELVYMASSDDKYSLAYNHEEAFMLLNPVTGEAVDYRGNVRQEEVQGIYTDIKGHAQEGVITKLFNSGIYLDERKLNPDDTITQKELISLLVRSKRWKSINNDEVYQEAYEMGLLEEKDYEPDKKISREEGIYELVKMTQFRKIAELADIFIYPYEDQDIDSRYKGAVAIACKFGWIEEAECFYPKKALSKAQFMVYLYHLLDTNDEDL